MLTLITAAALGTFAVGSMVYVYRLRGVVHYDGLSQYLRKSWPIFAPMNCLLYLSTQRRARSAIMELADFPELEALRQNWRAIRDEAMALYERQVFETTKQPASVGYFDVGFRTFYKYGWSKFYLRWYGYTHASAITHCPETSRILDRVPGINGAMFSVLPPGSRLTRHSDPTACSLRFHLGLVTPNDDRCYIDIDGKTHSWRNGEALLFDETYLHHARNDTDQVRIILMCDVDRPTRFPGSVVNHFYKKLMSLTLVPNDAGDRRGLANRIFAGVAPLVARSKALKKTHRGRYRLLKYSINLSLLAVMLGVLVSLSSGLLSLAAMFL